MFLHLLQILYVGGVVLLLFNFTIFFHELGHFLVARRRGAKVEQFSIWFGPAIWKKTFDGVEYRLGCIPLGGYVRLPQMGEEMIEGKSEVPQEEIKTLPPRDKIPILFAGSFANVLFGFFIAGLVWYFGVSQPASFFDLKVGYVEPDSSESRAGILPGDTIKTINGKPVENWDEVTLKVAVSLSEKVRVGIKRDGKILEKEVIPGRNSLLKFRHLNLEPSATPVAQKVFPGSPAAQAGIQEGDEIMALEGEKILGRLHMIHRIQERGGKPTHLLLNRHGKSVEVMVTPQVEKTSHAVRIGIVMDVKKEEMRMDHPSPFKQILQALMQMVETLNALIHHKTTGVGLGDLMGPVGIGQTLWIKISENFLDALSFLVLLNINLAVINLLPIPLLDGGHILFAIIEAVKGSPLNPKFLERIQTASLAILLTFFLYITFNDLRRVAEARMMEKKMQADDQQPAPVFEQKK